MTKEELVALVDRIHATWNQTIPAPQQKTVYEAWWRLLHDLNVDYCHAAIDWISTGGASPVGDLKFHGGGRHLDLVATRFMPKPGDVRRVVCAAAEGWDPPLPGEAWLQFRKMAEAAHTGTFASSMEIHPMVKAAVSRLGGAASYNLSTNADRELFSSIYAKVLGEYETTLNQLTNPNR